MRELPSSLTDSTVPVAVHVALHDVAAEAVPGAQRQLEVDLVADLEWPSACAGASRA